MAKLVGDSPDENLIKQMHQAWISFAHHGDPNTESLPNWQPYNKENRPTMIFNIESEIKNDPQKNERLLWENSMKE